MTPLKLPATAVALVIGLNAPASAEMRCEVAAVQVSGAQLEPTRASATRRYKGRACGAALASCEQRLQRLRDEYGGVMPYAACEVLEVTTVKGPPPFQRERVDLECDVSACESAYRSFRRSDCTYQPYRGPRRLCTK